MRALLRQAWQRGNEVKPAAWGCQLLIIGVALALSALWAFLGTLNPVPDGQDPALFAGFIDETIQTVVILPMGAGLWVAGIAFARGSNPSPWCVMYWYEYTLKLLLVSIFAHALIFAGLFLLVLPGIYLAVSFQLAIPLAVDKQIGPLQAIVESWRIVNRCWFRVLALDTIAVLAVLGSLALAGIPLLWVMPAILVGRGILYETLVGVETETLRKIPYNPVPSGLRPPPQRA